MRDPASSGLSEFLAALVLISAGIAGITIFARFDAADAQTQRPTSRDNLAPCAQNRNSFYVTPSGSSAGDGSVDHPWDLTTALNYPAAVKPGDTIWLRGGTYGSGGGTLFNSWLAGTATEPILVRQYPGERASINGGLRVYGPYTWWWGFEILNTWPQRISSQSGPFPTDIPQPIGITPVDSSKYPAVRGVKFINLVIHDTANGLGAMSAAPGTEMYGCLSYNNGWVGTDRGHGHGVYIQNSGDLKLISDNFIFNNFDAGLHPSGTPAATIQNIWLVGNVVFNNGMGGGHRVDNVIVEGGGTPKKNILLDSNFVYNPASQPSNSGYSRVGWQFDGPNADLVMQNNVWVGGDPALMVANWTKVQFNNNTFYVQTGESYSGEVQLRLLAGQDTSQYTWDGNTYYANAWRLFMLFEDGVNTFGGGFEGWQAATRLDAHSRFVNSRPTGIWTYVRPNRYEPGRANVVIYNWDLKSAVAVDLYTAGLAVGQGYEIRDVQNFFGPPVGTGYYDGRPVTIPMADTTIAQPVGGPSQLSNTAPEFGAFVVLPAPAAPPRARDCHPATPAPRPRRVQ